MKKFGKFLAGAAAVAAAAAAVIYYFEKKKEADFEEDEFDDFEDFAHVIVGLSEGDGVVFDDGVVKNFSVATFDDDFFADFGVWKMFENADDVWTAVVAVNNDGTTRAGFGGLVIPTGLEDVVRSVEGAGASKANGDDLATPDVAEAWDGDVARVRSGDSKVGDFFGGWLGLVNFLRLDFSADNIGGTNGAGFV